MFEDEEIDELKVVLKELAERLEISLDVEKMLSKNNIKKGSGKRYYIVVTVVQYPIIYI